MKTKLLTTTLLLSLSFPAVAIVNVEGMRLGKPQEGLSGNLDLSISGKNGNTEKQEVGIDGRLQKHEDKTTDFVVVSYDYGETSDVRNTNKTFIHGRHIVQFQPKRAWEAFAQAGENEFTRLSFRGLLGVGLRLTIFEDTDSIGLYLGVGAFYSRETLDNRIGLTDGGTEKFSRGNIYLSYKHKINDQLSVISTTYYQPRFGHTEDYRALEQAALAVKMTERLSLKISLNIAHDSRPPETIQKTDSTYETALSYSF
jgi:putative salt-induced outer membrane protein YdiY